MLKSQDSAHAADQEELRGSFWSWRRAVQWVMVEDKVKAFVPAATSLLWWPTASPTSMLHGSAHAIFQTVTVLHSGRVLPILWLKAGSAKLQPAWSTPRREAWFQSSAHVFPLTFSRRVNAWGENLRENVSYGLKCQHLHHMDQKQDDAHCDNTHSYIPQTKHSFHWQVSFMN